MEHPSSTPGFWSARRAAFGHAWRGFIVLVSTQAHARFHLCATAAVAGLGLATGLSAADWCWIVLAVVAVWTAEAFNTAVEKLADACHPGLHPLIGQAKDLAAAGVGMAALGAALIGLLVFIPHWIAG
jgi:diacylglycerol kinase